MLAYPRGRELEDFDAPWPARRAGVDDARPGDPALGLCGHRRRLAGPLPRPHGTSSASRSSSRPDSPAFAAADPPLVSAIIPAKDEEATLADCLASVCAPGLSRTWKSWSSTTGAPTAPREIAREFADARPAGPGPDQRPPSRPAGRARPTSCSVAAGRPAGDWFWFLDADTRHAPENLGDRDGVRPEPPAPSCVSLLPELRCETFWESVVQPLAGIVLMQSFPLFRVNDDRSKLAFANGQYILIRATAYDAAGGHAAVRDRFVEDIGMAQQGQGARPADPGRRWRTGSARRRMYASLGQLVRGWSRILYDALGRKPWRLLGRLLDPLVFCQSGHVALLAAVVMLAAGAGPVRSPTGCSA